MIRSICRWLLLIVIWSSIPAIPQQPVAPPPKPADAGPSREATMNFLQDKLNGQGRVGFVRTASNAGGITERDYVLFSDVVGDSSSCNLNSTVTVDVSKEVAEGTTDAQGKPVAQLKIHVVEKGTIPLKYIEKIVVEGLQEHFNRMAAQNAHPEVVITITPAAFYLEVIASKPVISFRESSANNDEAPEVKDRNVPDYGFTIRDEETANRLAKALTHAVELCGGGNKDPF